MSGFGAAAVLAIFLGLILLFFLLVPYVAWAYRRRGTLGPGHAALAALALIHFVALWTYTISPMPDPATLQCAAGGAGMNLIPFASLGDLNIATHGLRDPALLQILANIALFVPFGMLARHLFNLKPGWVVLAGAGLSLLIELTQLTGVWGIYPCSYRIFDVDDLLTNTLGTAIGLAAAPLLRFVPGQQALPPDAPRIVGRSRRLVGMALDLLGTHAAAFLLYLPLALLIRDSGLFGDRTQVPYAQISAAALLVTSALLLLVLPLARRGATPGQLATLVRPVPAGPSPATPSVAGHPSSPPSTTTPPPTSRSPLPSRRAILIRWAVGSGGYFVIDSLSTLTNTDALAWLGYLWIVVAAAVVVLRHPRGLSGYAAGVTVVDARDPRAEASRAREVDPRSLGSAVVASVAAAFAGFGALAALGSLAPTVGAAFGLIGMALLALGTLALVPFLIANGVVAVRREGIGLLTGLPLAAAAGILALLAFVALAVLSGNGWLIVSATAALAMAGYLGLLFVAFLGYGQWYAHRSPTTEASAVVVLGSRVFGERVPPLLAARLDRGIEALGTLLAGDPESRAVLVCSGGQGSDERVAEGEAMANYVVGRGVPEDRVRREVASRTTDENLQLSRELLRAEGIGEPLVVVTNDFHAFRAAIISRELGIAAQVIGAPTARYYFPASLIREYVAVLARTPVVHAVVAVALAVLAGAIAALFVL